MREFLIQIDQSNERFFENLEKEDKDGDNEFKDIPTIGKLKSLLKNYWVITEAQDNLLKANLSLTSKIPLPEDISAPGSRFRIITDWEIEEMQNRVA